MITSDLERRQHRFGRRLTSSQPLDNCFPSDITGGVLGSDSGSGNDRVSEARSWEIRNDCGVFPINPLTSDRFTWKISTPFLRCSRRNSFHPLSEAVRRSFFNSRRKHSAPSVYCAI